jgi:hypothetical protein
MFVGTDLPGTFGFFFAIIAAILVVAAWVILAGSRFIQGGVVERPERVPQLYGYTVCLISLLWALASVTSIVDNALSLSAPELRGSTEYGWEASVSSFEAFRTTYDRARQYSAPNPTDVKLDSLSEAELRRRFEALRADRIRRGRYEAHHQLLLGALSLLISAALFVFHWRWLRGTTLRNPAQA